MTPKHTHLLSLSFLFLITGLQINISRGQDWECIKTEGDYFFISASGEIKAIRIDSVVNNGQFSLYYPFTTIRSTGDFAPCYSKYGAPWTGRPVVASTSGMTYFLNQNQDSVRIASHANVNEPWVAYVCPDGKIVEARITEVAYENVLGFSDSVKTVTFKMTDSLGNVIQTSLNDYTLKISKNHGLTKAFNFFLFPDSIGQWYQIPLNEQQSQYYLCGIGSIPAGIQNISAHEIFNFAIGDEFHTESINNSSIPPVHYDSIYEIRKVIGRNDLPGGDSTFYTYHRIMKRSYYYGGQSSTWHYNDTLTDLVIYADHQELAWLPEELAVIYSSQPVYFTMTMKTGINGRLVKTEPPFSLHFVPITSDSCLMLPIYDGPDGPSDYIEGLGGPYGTQEWFPWMLIKKTLLYYGKGDEQWGTPLDPGVLLNAENTIQPDAGNYKLYPNPTANIFTIELSDSRLIPYSFNVVDIQGRQVFCTRLISAVTEIELPGLSKGLYFFQLKSDNQLTDSGKLIIQ